MTPRKSRPEFTLDRVIHREKSGLIVDMKWSIGGEYLFIVKNKSIMVYEFDISKHPVLKVKHIVDDKYFFFTPDSRSFHFVLVLSTVNSLTAP